MAQFHNEWIVQPHGSIEEVAAGILSVEGSIVMPLGRFPRRMTIIDLYEGGTAIWSPVALEETEMARVDALGPVRYIIVPNEAHRLDLKPWHDRYPAAKVIAPNGSREKVAQAAAPDATRDIIDDVDLSFHTIPGMKIDEFALTVKRADGVTLVLNDILSNIRHPHGLGAHIMAHLFGFGTKRPRTSTIVKLKYISDANAVAAQFLEWSRIPNLRRIIVSHGDVIDRDPEGALRRAAADFK